LPVPLLATFRASVPLLSEKVTRKSVTQSHAGKTVPLVSLFATATVINQLVLDPLLVHLEPFFDAHLEAPVRIFFIYFVPRSPLFAVAQEQAIFKEWRERIRVFSVLRRGGFDALRDHESAVLPCDATAHGPRENSWPCLRRVPEIGFQSSVPLLRWYRVIERQPEDPPPDSAILSRNAWRVIHCDPQLKLRNKIE